ncbi:alpha/beta fold hydrolase [Dactylosporangium sp. NPDC000244]|uniref:thioesterase II family protein n=1 Tax=Dactylosporangium sp. NPDC000244 TaxID=3154365 RepID=UPI00331F5025
MQEHDGDATGSSWIRRFHPRPDCLARLVCLPPAGQSASFYFSLSDEMTVSIEVLAVQYPGRQDRWSEPHVLTIQDLARKIHAALGTWMDRPLLLFGHGMGALVAFELARRLEREGTVPMVLFPSARAAPSCAAAGFVHLRHDEGIVAHLQAVSGTQSPLPDDAQLLQLMLPAIRDDYRADETYVYEPGSALRCPIIAFVGEDDPTVVAEDVVAWWEHTEGPFELLVVPGGHFFVLTNQSEVVNTISDFFLAPR